MTARSVSERMLCSYHGDFAAMNRLPACPLCGDELVARLEAAEAQLERAATLASDHLLTAARQEARAEAAEAQVAALTQERDEWERTARKYETISADAGLL